MKAVRGTNAQHINIISGKQQCLQTVEKHGARIERMNCFLFYWISVANGGEYSTRLLKDMVGMALPDVSKTKNGKTNQRQKKRSEIGRRN